MVSSAIVDKYIGESARLIREMFAYAKDHEPCVIFMDEIDAIGGRRFSEGTSADREIQRTLMEVCCVEDLMSYWPFELRNRQKKSIVGLGLKSVTAQSTRALLTWKTPTGKLPLG